MKRKLLYVLSIVCMAMVLAACGNNQAQQTADEEDDKSTLAEDTAGGAAVLHSDDFYQRLLDAFCQAHYDEKMPGKYDGALSVGNVAQADTRTVDISGKFRFKGRGLGPARLPHNGREYEATVTDEGNDRYHIEFKHKDYFGSADGRWVTTGRILFEYKE